MKVVKAASAVALALAASGCATVIRGTKQDIAIQSTPPGATATLSTGQTCVTPCSLHLPRKVDFDVTYNLEGYAPATQHVTSGWSRGGTTTFVAGNLILGGLIGMGVDAGTGATRDLRPNPVEATLNPVAPVVAEAAPAAAPATPAAPAQ